MLLNFSQLWWLNLAKRQEQLLLRSAIATGVSKIAAAEAASTAIFSKMPRVRNDPPGVRGSGQTEPR